MSKTKKCQFKKPKINKKKKKNDNKHNDKHNKHNDKHSDTKHNNNDNENNSLWKRNINYLYILQVLPRHFLVHNVNNNEIEYSHQNTLSTHIQVPKM